MKIVKQLLISEFDTILIKDSIRLDMMTPGRAIIDCSSETQPVIGQSIEVNGQFADEPLRRLFYGFIESVSEAQAGVYHILARELSSILNQRIAINLRHCTPEMVLEEVSNKTGLQFVVPQSLWVDKTISRFQHIGGGYLALDSIIRLWNIRRGFWHQQPDGKIYIGEIEKSVPGQKVIEIEPSLFSATSVVGGTLPLIPRLRPGVQIKIANKTLYINSIEITNDQMRLNWLMDPWAKQLQAVR